jgi:hypothetical protein
MLTCLDTSVGHSPVIVAICTAAATSQVSPRAMVKTRARSAALRLPAASAIFRHTLFADRIAWSFSSGSAIFAATTAQSSSVATSWATRRSCGSLSKAPMISSLARPAPRPMPARKTCTRTRTAPKPAKRERARPKGCARPNSLQLRPILVAPGSAQALAALAGSSAGPAAPPAVPAGRHLRPRPARP